MIIYHNQQFIAKSSASIDIENRAFRFGDGLFETIKLDKNQIPLHLDKHISRMLQSMTCLKIKHDNNTDYIQFFLDIINKLCNLNNVKDKNLGARILAYRNCQSRGYLPIKTEDDANNAAFVVELFEINANQYINNKIMISSYQRQFNRSLPIFSKSANSLQFVMAKLEAEECGCFDAIMLNENGYICEFSSGNIFWQIDNVFYTPSLDNGLINGIMRLVFIENLKQQDKIINEGSFIINDLYRASKIYFTNAISGIIEVKMI